MAMNPRLLRPLARFQAPPANPFATLVSTKSTGNVLLYAKSSTGYVKVEWWDATSNVSGTGVADDSITLTKAAGGAGSKTFRIYPSDASGDLDGALTVLEPYDISLTSLDVSGCTALTSLSCSYNSLTSLDVSGLTALETLFCSYNSLTSLDVSGCTALTLLECINNSLTSLDVSGLTALTLLYCSNNSLTSVRAQNVGFSNGYYSSSGYGVNSAILNNNQLGAAALNQFYTDLAAGDSFVFVFNNPGTASDNPSIATAKGYTVYGS